MKEARNPATDLLKRVIKKITDQVDSELKTEREKRIRAKIKATLEVFVREGLVTKPEAEAAGKVYGVSGLSVSTPSRYDDYSGGCGGMTRSGNRC